jgi:hypothetical protein
VDKAVKAARKAFASWSQTSREERMDVLNRILAEYQKRFGDLAVAVTEPTPSGRHDLERVAGLCGHFRIPLAVIINKYDLNPEETSRIAAFCREGSYPVAARLPHDLSVTKAMIQGLVATELPETAFSVGLKRAWGRIQELAGLNRQGFRQASAPGE